MPPLRFKPLTPINRSKHHFSKKERAERKAKVNREKRRRIWARMSKEERRERKQREDARLFDWARVLPHVDKLESGCWLWTGPLLVRDGRVRPIMRAGLLGRQNADFVVCCLARGYPPLRCKVTRTCETLGCVAPSHLAWTVAVVERAKKRRQRHDEEELARGQQG